MNKNYHTHTFRCQHAAGADSDYAAAAVACGFEKLGFSDHTPWPYEGFVSGMRMPASQLADYAESIHALRAQYKGRLDILLGLECEYFPEYLPWLCAMAEKHGLDYLILGHHFSGPEPNGMYNGNLRDAADVVRYQQDVCAAMKTGLFSYLCHPDLFMRGYQVFDKTAERASRAIIETAIATGTPLEYNLLGVRIDQSGGSSGYPCPAFWQLAADYKATAILGVDAHTPDVCGDEASITFAEQTLAQLGIPLTDEIRLLTD